MDFHQLRSASFLALLILVLVGSFQACSPAPARNSDAKASARKESSMQTSEVSQQSPPIPEMIGATTAPFSLSKGMTHVSLAMHAPTGPAAQRADRTPIRVFLK